jgi:hypothetical protein
MSQGETNGRNNEKTQQLIVGEVAAKGIFFV